MTSLKNVQPFMNVWAVCVFLLSNCLDAIVDRSNDLYNEMFFYFHFETPLVLFKCH